MDILLINTFQMWEKKKRQGDSSCCKAAEYLLPATQNVKAQNLLSSPEAYHNDAS